MSKIFKCISLVLVLVMMLSMTAFASTSISAPVAECNKDVRTVKLSGTVSEAVENQQVVVLVLKSTANLESVSDDDIAYVDQIAADADGKFEFNFAIDESKGDKFTAYVGGTAVAAPQFATVNFGGGPGDFDQSGEVDLFDYLAFVGTYGKKSGEAGYIAEADLDPSGEIDLFDYLAFVGVYGSKY